MANMEEIRYGNRRGDLTALQRNLTEDWNFSELDFSSMEE